MKKVVEDSLISCVAQEISTTTEGPGGGIGSHNVRPAYVGGLNINQSVREHQVLTHWEYRDVCELCWRFFDGFREMYFRDVPDCYFHVESANKRTRMAYKVGDNGIGAEHDCMLNAKWLGRPVYEIGAYVLHALIHMWQESLGTHSKNCGHNKAFLRKAVELDINSKPSHGCEVILPIKDSFIATVAKIEPDYMRPCVVGIKDPILSVKKWLIYSCKCGRRELPPKADVTCSVCGEKLKLDAEAVVYKYSCNCISLKTLDAVNLICNKCNLPITLEQ